MKFPYVSIFEFLFNELLIVQWAMFLWYTLTPRWSKKATFLIFLPICLFAPMVSTIFPSRSAVRMFSVPVIMILAAFVCYRSKPPRTLFCAFYPQMAIVLSEALILLVLPDIYRNNYDSTQLWRNYLSSLPMLIYTLVYSLMIWIAASCIGKTRYRLTARQWLVFLFFPLSQTMGILFAYNTMFSISPSAAQLYLLAGILVVCAAADFAHDQRCRTQGGAGDCESDARKTAGYPAEPLHGADIAVRGQPPHPARYSAPCQYDSVPTRKWSAAGGDGIRRAVPC